MGRKRHVEGGEWGEGEKEMVIKTDDFAVQLISMSFVLLGP